MLLMVAILLLANIPINAFAQNRILFTDDFSSNSHNAWSSKSSGTVSNGQYVMKADSIDTVNSIGKLKNISVTSVASVSVATLETGFSSGVAAYVTSRTDETGNSGYDFGIGVSKTGKTYIRLYRRNPFGTSEILYQQSSSVEGLGTIKQKTDYRIRLAITDNHLLCYINDCFITEVEDNTFSSGYVGLRTLGGEVKFKDFSVESLPEKVVEKISVTSFEDNISKSGKLFFNLSVKYNDIYGNVTLNQDSDGITISGLDGTSGKKNVTISYGGKSTTIKVNVLEKYVSKTLFEDDFNSDLSNWQGGSTKNSEYGFTYQFIAENGKAIAREPNLNGADVNYYSTLYLAPSKVEDYHSYSVETNAVILNNASTKSKRLGMVGLRFAETSEGTYEFRVRSDGLIYVYCDSDMVYSTTSAKVLGYDVGLNTNLNLRAEVYDEYFTIYLNGKKVCQLTDNIANVSPYIGLTVIAGTAYFDNIKVKEVESKGYYAISSIHCYNCVNDKIVTEYSGNTVNLNDFMLLIKYIDGDTRLKKITNNMISNYSKVEGKRQKITITYFNKTTSFTYTYVPYMFVDTFDNSYKSSWLFGSSNYLSVGIENGRLRVDYSDTTTSDTQDILASIKDGTNWNNYAVSADVYLQDKKNANGKNPYVGIIARYNSDTRSYYEFRIYSTNTTGKISGELYKKTSGKAEALSTFSNNLLKKYVSKDKTLMSGEQYNLKLEVKGNTINTYIDGNFIASYTDTSDNPLLTGTAGISFINSNCYIDNFKVEERSDATAKRIELVDSTTGNVSNSIDVIRGNTIDVWKYNLHVIYSDDAVIEVPLTSEMISNFDKDELGKQTVSLNYNGQQYSLTINIKERKEYVSKFEKEIKSFPKKVTKKKLNAFLKLKETFDTLSPYEVQHLSKGLYKKYSELLVSYDKLKYPSLKKESVLVNETFDAGNLDLWGDNSAEFNSTVWQEINSVAYEAAIPYNLFSSNGWKSPDLFGKIKSISADCMMLTDKEYMGIAFNISDVGYYHIRISNMDVDETTEEVLYKLQLYKKTSAGHKLVKSVILSAFDIDLKLNQWFNMRLMLDGTKVSAYINDILVASYEDSSGMFTSGECGLRISQGDGLYDNVRVYGEKLNREDEKVKIKPTKYKDDFEDESIGKNPSHWVEYREFSSEKDDWFVYKDNSKVYGTKSKGSTATMLHVFDNNPKMSFRFKAFDVSKVSDFGIITRRSPDTAFLNVGYNVEKKKWYVASQISQYEGTQYYWSENEFSFKPNNWYNAELELNKTEVKLLIDGKEVISVENVGRMGYGKLGFFTNNAGMYVDDISCTFASGDIPQDGVISFETVDDTYAGFMEIDSPNNGKTLYGVSQSRRRMSNNYGTTWQDVTSDTDYSGLTCSTDYISLFKMSNGKYLQISGENDYAVYESSDLKNWKQIGQVLSNDDIYDGHLRLALHTLNSITEIALKDGTQRLFVPVSFRRYALDGTSMGHYSCVYYSDDFGKTWSHSSTTTKELLPGYSEDEFSTWAESKVIACSDGTLRMYYSRNYLGCMQYTVSKDGGLTWDGLYQIPEMQCAMTSYAIAEDTQNKGTYYMLWVNGKTSYLGSIHPRTRICLAKSTDGMNWTFLMECERMTETISKQNGEELYQILDPSLYVTDEYVHITFGRSSLEDSSTPHQAQRAYYIRVEKDKLNEREWDSSTIASMQYPKSIKIKKSPQTKFGVGDLFTCFGTLELTDFLGKKKTVDISDSCIIGKEPNMFKLGKSVVNLYYKNGYDLSYDINIVKNYNIVWKINGNGTVKGKQNKIMQDATKTFELKPDNGYKVKKVIVNGKNSSVRFGKLTISKANQNYQIEVYFVQKSIFDYWWILVIIVFFGIAVYEIYYYKLNKKLAYPKFIKK